MEWVVTSGETIEAATEAALDELGIDLDEAEIEVLEEPRAGLFGIHKRDARVRARVAPTTPRPKVERRDRRRRSGGEAKNGGGSTAKATKGGDDADRQDDGEAAPAAPRKRSRKRAATKPADESSEASGPDETSDDAGAAAAPRKRARKRAAAPAVDETPDDASAEGDPEPAPKKRTRKRAAVPPVDDVSAAAPAEGDTEPAPRKRSRKRAAAEPAPTTASSPVEGDDEAESTEQGAPMTSISIEDQVEVIEDFLDGLMEAFDLDGEISTTEIDEETSEVRVEGDELGYLIGPKGQTLAAIHELCRTVAQRRLAGPHEGRIRLDIGGYRERRREALTRFATQVAEEVRSSGVEKALEPMSPPDRKVVHDTINEIDGVQTSSEGEEPRRRVVVSPVD